jgi:hypothetical protein
METSYLNVFSVVTPWFHKVLCISLHNDIATYHRGSGRGGAAGPRGSAPQ